MGSPEYQRLWRIAHPEATRAHRAKWRRANPEQSRVIDRRSYQKNKTSHLEASRNWKTRNPDRIKEYKRKYYATHPSERARNHKSTQSRRNADPEKFRQYSRRSGAKGRDLLTDWYVIHLIKQNSAISTSLIPRSLIESWRNVIKAKRLLKEVPHGSSSRSK